MELDGKDGTERGRTARDGTESRRDETRTEPIRDGMKTGQKWNRTGTETEPKRNPDRTERKPKRERNGNGNGNGT